MTVFIRIRHVELNSCLVVLLKQVVTTRGNAIRILHFCSVHKLVWVIVDICQWILGSQLKGIDLLVGSIRILHGLWLWWQLAQARPFHLHLILLLLYYLQQLLVRLRRVKRELIEFLWRAQLLVVIWPRQGSFKRCTSVVFHIYRRWLRWWRISYPVVLDGSCRERVSDYERRIGLYVVGQVGVRRLGYRIGRYRVLVLRMQIPEILRIRLLNRHLRLTDRRH